MNDGLNLVYHLIVSGHSISHGAMINNAVLIMGQFGHLLSQGFLEDFVFWGGGGGDDLLCEQSEQFFFGGGGEPETKRASRKPVVN